MNRIKILAVYLLLVLTCCSEDDPIKKPVSINSIVATGNDVNTNGQIAKILSEEEAAINIPTNSSFVISFSKAITEETAISENIKITKLGVTVPADILIDGKTIIVTPENPLELETDYVLVFGSGIKAVDGSKFIEATINFSTQREPIYIESLTATGSDIVTEEELTRLFSEEGVTTNVPINSSFEVSFSKAVAQETATTSNIKLRKSGENVPATITINGERITVTPLNELQLETSYTLWFSSAIKPAAADGVIFTETEKSFTTQDSPLKIGLVAHYTFEGGLAQDKSGFGNFGVITGAQPVTDKSNREDEALYFSSVADRVTVNSPSFLNNAVGTFAAWVKFDNLNNSQYLASVADIGSTSYYMSFIRIDGADHSVGTYWRNDTEVSWLKSSTQVTTGVYYHMVLVGNGVKFRIYINGEEIELTEFQGSNTGKWIAGISNLDNFSLGTLWMQSPYTVPNLTGNLDEVRLYNRVLSEREISLLYTQTK
jgi:Concanavalin A-like lectin/glucanases superfamily/Bacterial Ig-like domain